MADRGAIHVTVVGATDVGRVREHNEDNLLVADLTAGDRTDSGRSISRDLGERGLLLAVADGMGGAASGSGPGAVSVVEEGESLSLFTSADGPSSTSACPILIALFSP